MRYYFDIFDGDHWTRDDAGMDCRDDRAARYQAVLALTEMAGELLPANGDEMALRVHVRAGEYHRFTVKLDFATEAEAGVLGKQVGNRQSADHGRDRNNHDG